ncbi:MAG TPA: hypothetical protein VFY20_06015 [Gemmatimonadales bacterium]|nr:hypothetical protein [Gemmatimonadales bacterium]
MSRRRTLLLLVAGALLGAGAASALTDRHWLLLDGSDWQRYSGAEREAWTQGFLAGHAVGRLPDSVSRDTVASAAELARRRQEGSFALPYASPVYTARLGDYYRWENHQAHPLWRGLLNVHAELRR